MPPAVAAGALASIRYVKGAQHLRDRHQERARTLMGKIKDAGLPLMPSISHIVPVLVGDATMCKQASDLLMDRHNIYVQPINYPTVPLGTERLRITPSPLHTDEMMDDLVAALADVWGDLSLKWAA
jgi:5-aminolevulinate synthase